MKPLQQFDDCLRQGIVKKQSPDSSRAEFLQAEAKKAYAFLQKKLDVFAVDEETANDFIKNCYDIIMELIRSKMLLQGYNASGNGAHEAEVAYLRRLGYKESDVRFANQLRYFRNGMLYYGELLDADYAKKVLAFTHRLYKKLSL